MVRIREIINFNNYNIRRKLRKEVLIDYENLRYRAAWKIEYLLKDISANPLNTNVKIFTSKVSNSIKLLKLVKEYQIEVIDIEEKHTKGKNAADFYLIADAYKTLYQKKSRINHFIISSGDEDFIPLYDSILESGIRLSVYSNRSSLSKKVKELIGPEITTFPRFINVGKEPIVQKQVKNDQVLLNAISALYLFEKKYKLNALSEVFRFLFENFNTKSIGYSSLGHAITQAQSRGWVEYDRNSFDIICNSKKMLSMDEISPNLYPWVLHELLRKHDKKLGLPKYGRQWKGFEAITLSLKSVPKGIKVNMKLWVVKYGLDFLEHGEILKILQLFSMEKQIELKPKELTFTVKEDLKAVQREKLIIELVVTIIKNSTVNIENHLIKPFVQQVMKNELQSTF